MMTSENPEKPAPRRRPYLIPGIAAVCLLIGALTIRFLAARPAAPGRAADQPTLEINLPSVDYPTIPPSAPEFTAIIHGVGPAGVTGRVTFKDIAGTVAILLYIDGLPEDEESEESLMPAELRYGTCASPGELAYRLSVPDAGQSETDLSINLKEFNTQKPMAVLLYRSTQDDAVIACGDLP